jgi:hypothetical protein
MARVRLILLLLLIALDCVMNCLTGGSIKGTLSARAWNLSGSRAWNLFRLWVDWIFACPAIGQMDHCRIQAERETQFGSVWVAWAARFTAAKGDRA